LLLLALELDFDNGLSSYIDDLEDSLAPLLDAALSASTSKLPLLDKAKLYVLATYAIESLLFSYLRLDGANAKSHPVFTELTRVKQYFDKIKVAESAGVRPAVTLDKGAAGRFIKHGLAGNEKYDRERAEIVAKEKLGAKRKLEELSGDVGSHNRWAGMSKKMKADDDKARLAKAQNGQADGSGNNVIEDERPIFQEGVVEEDESMLDESGVTNQTTMDDQGSEDTGDKASQKSKKRSKKRDRHEQNAGTSTKTTENVVPQRTKSHQPPRGHGEAFQALLKGPLPKHEEKKSKKSRRSRGKGESREAKG